MVVSRECETKMLRRHFRNKTVNFGYGPLEFEFSMYVNGRLAVCLNCADTSEPYARISVNLPDCPAPPAFHFYAKTWSGNEDIVKELEKDGVIERTGPVVVVNTHGSEAPLYRFVGIKTVPLASLNICNHEKTHAQVESERNESIAILNGTTNTD